MAPLRDWHWPSEVTSSPYAWNVYFWMALYNSYLGATGQKDNEDYTASWDINDASFSYNWRLAGKDWDYSALKAAVEDAIKDLSLRFDGTSQATWLTRQPPVSALQLKYRVNPAGAYAGDYKFRMIDRSLAVKTKAAGDNRSHAVSKLEVIAAAGDQWNVTGYVDYFKYWADKPTEWFLHLAATKSALAWYYWDAFGGITDVPNKPRAERDAMNLFSYFYNDYLGYSTTDRQVVNAMDKWQELNGLNYETIVALEASKDGYGDEAIVSNYAAVKLEYVYPIWTAYHREAADNTVARWPLAYNWVKYLNGSQALVHPNDYLTEGQEYDVAAHMRFADPYYGRLENLGFKVKYDYYVFCAENSEPARSYQGPWGDTDDNQSGEHEFDFGAWDKVEVTSDGKVRTKEGVSGAIGQYVLIVADASIYNEAQGNYYRASVGRGSHMALLNDQVPVVDEFIGHYLMLIIPDSAGTVNVENGGLTITSGIINGHKWVDLGLPSGLKWATCNVGANAPEEYGDYFAWGETEPYYSSQTPLTWKTGKTGYDWASYKWCNGSSNTQTKYCTSSSYGTVDNKAVLDPEDDAARANWGGSWRMPTDEEWTELRTECTWTGTTQNGVYGSVFGSLVTGPNGNSIFLPAAGYRLDTYLYNTGSYGYCWSSSLNTDYPSDAWYVFFGSGNGLRYYSRFDGQSVRPVTE